jgi:hypothetical protein
MTVGSLASIVAESKLLIGDEPPEAELSAEMAGFDGFSSALVIARRLS